MTIGRTGLAFAAMTVPVVASRAYQQLNRNWHATAREREMMLPGDDILAHPEPPTTMAITIDAPPEAVWPWLVQMGVDRAGFYTHLWVENAVFHLGVTNADRIVPEWQDLAPGDTVAFVRGTPEKPGFGPFVERIDEPRAMTMVMGRDVASALMTWQFILQPLPEDRTRLILRSRSNGDRPLMVKVFDFLFEAGYTYMDIGMLRGIAARAARPLGAG